LYPTTWCPNADWLRRADYTDHKLSAASFPGEIMRTIAVIDNDFSVLSSTSTALEAEGYRTVTYSDSASALSKIHLHAPDLAILDLAMPNIDGIEMLRRLRRKSDTPVIFLSSRADEIDELFGLKLGADDFIRKPFSQRVLIERVRAILRRAAPNETETVGKPSTAPVLERGHLRMDSERYNCTWKNISVKLTTMEFTVVQALANRPGMVKSRAALTADAHDENVNVDYRAIDSHIKRIRQKMKNVDASFDLVETIHKIGYRWKE
jgi:two-component system, OmpR family, response regulator ChvI